MNAVNGKTSHLRGKSLELQHTSPPPPHGIAFIPAHSGTLAVPFLPLLIIFAHFLNNADAIPLRGRKLPTLRAAAGQPFPPVVGPVPWAFRPGRGLQRGDLNTGQLSGGGAPCATLAIKWLPFEKELGLSFSAWSGLEAETPRRGSGHRRSSGLALRGGLSPIGGFAAEAAEGRPLGGGEETVRLPFVAPGRPGSAAQRPPPPAARKAGVAAGSRA